MADRQAKGIVTVSFLAGIALAVCYVLQGAWEPVPQPFFGLEEPISVAAPLPQQPRVSKPTVVHLSPPVGNLSSMAAAMPAVVKPGPKPERLASATPHLSSHSGVIDQNQQDDTLHTDSQEKPRLDNVPKKIINKMGTPDATPLFVEPAAPESLKSLVTRVHIHRLTAEEPARPDSENKSPSQPARMKSPATGESLGAAPLPGSTWTDPDSVNWTKPANAASRPTSDDETTKVSSPGPVRLLDRLLSGERIFNRNRRESQETGSHSVVLHGIPDVRKPGSIWPHPATLISELNELQKYFSENHGDRTQKDISPWAQNTLIILGNVLTTSGPRDPIAAPLLINLGEAVHVGMELADRSSEGKLASSTRRAALAVSRRVAVWRAIAGMLADVPPDEQADQVQLATPDPLLIARSESDAGRLMESLERYEISRNTSDASFVKEALRSVESSPLVGAKMVVRSVTDHYLSPNMRIAIHRDFAEKLLPDTDEKDGPFAEVINGRVVRGNRKVVRTTTVQFAPNHDEVAMVLEVHGDIASRSTTNAGPAKFSSQTASKFVVRKPISISSQGLLLGPATGAASNNSRLAGIQTSFDSVPVMRSLARSLAKSQHDNQLPEVNREIINKIIARACRETDERAEPEFTAAAERIRERLWMPLVKLGLDPTPVVLESTPSIATIRLRLAADNQVAAHTPRPRAPTDARLSMQLHESALNNALERLTVAGQSFFLEDLVVHICNRIGIEASVPEDLPEGVEVTFEGSEPVRITCKDGLVQVRVALDAIETSRRSWYDVIAQVSYSPVVSGSQVFLERDGPIRIGGPGHQGRLELGLRTIFGKIFPKEKPIPIVPDRIVTNPRLDGTRVVQAVSHDGWFALALATREPPATVSTPRENTQEAARSKLFR